MLEHFLGSGQGVRKPLSNVVFFFVDPVVLTSKAYMRSLIIAGQRMHLFTIRHLAVRGPLAKFGA